MKEKKSTLFLRINLLGLAMCCIMLAQGQGRYVTGDFHQHTTYTDGFYTMGFMMEKNNEFGLDWWANSEHGGAFNRWGTVDGIDLGTSVTWDNTGIALKGKANDNNMWRWQSLTDWSFRDVLLYRRVFPDKLIIQAYEMNVPGHEHASLGIIGNQFDAANPDVNDLALFEYLFDAVDTDDSNPLGASNKNTTNDHAKAVEAASWLQTNHPTDSWFIPAHPERFRYPSGTANYEGYNIEHLRDLNNAAPDVFFGFESMPGHQMAASRGEYHAGRGLYGSYGIGTYGGAGWMCAKIGGLWDAMLSEGRHFWLFVNSDSHTNEPGQGDFFPGEYQKTYTYVNHQDVLTAQDIVDGMRSGNSYIVNGDLINELQFTVGAAMMGETAQTSDGKATITVRVHNPQTPNNNRYSTYTIPQLDHFDIIEGIVSGKITPPATVPADGQTGYSDAYKCDSVNTTKVIARFGKTASAADPNGIPTVAWTSEGNGYYSATLEVTLAEGESKYYRLRGTNQALNTTNETDDCGNPLPDSLMGTNDAAKAFADLWFYSNPVFVNNGTTGINEVNGTNSEIQVYPNPANDLIYIRSGNNIKELRIFNTLGALVKEESGFVNEINIGNLTSGVYNVQIKTNNDIIVNRKVIKK